MEKLAIFDVDFTITKKETLLEFYKFMVKSNAKYLIYLPKILFAGILYGLKILDAEKAKLIFISFINGIKEKDMDDTVSKFYKEKLSLIIYEEAYNTIRERKKEGCLVYLISASPEFYLKEFYNIKEIDKILGTKVVMQDGVYKRKFIGRNCKGEEKVIRLNQVLKEENIQVDFKNSYMYSDSLSDLPLFNMVGNPYLINSKGKKTKIKILKWK